MKVPLITSLCFLAFSCNLSAGHASPAQTQEVVAIEIPEVYELANIILALTDYGKSDKWEVRKDIAYYDELMAFFSKVSSHPLLDSVNYSRERWKEYLSFRTDAYAFGYDSTGRIGRSFDYYTNDGYAPFDRNLELINEFSAASGFRDFYRNHKDYYQSIVDSYSDQYLIDEMKQFLTEEFGDYGGDEKYAIVLSPLVYRMNCHREIDSTLVADFPTVAAYILEGRSPDSEAEQSAELHTLFTEMSHGYVNPISGLHRDQIEQKFNERKWNESDGYQSASATFNEYMTWVVFDIFNERHFPRVADEVNLYWHFQNKSRGFIYAALFAEELTRLYHSHGPSAALRDIYPELLDWCASVQDSLSLPTVESPADSIVVDGDGPVRCSLSFSEPMLEADSVNVLIRHAAGDRDTLLVDHSADMVWSNGGRELSFVIDIPLAEGDYLFFNWWGTRIPLIGRNKVLLNSPTALKIVRR